MYHGLSSINQTPTAMRPDIKDCIFRFKIAPAAFSDIENVADGNNTHPLFNKDTYNKKAPLSREKVLERLLTGRKFCFLFTIEGIINGLQSLLKV